MGRNNQLERLHYWNGGIEGITPDRMHTLVTLTITQFYHTINPNEYEDRIEEIRSRVVIVDLKGSERQSKVGNRGRTLKDACKVGLSMSAFGNVISALADHRSTHIPYRDSVLTRLLQNSFGGNTITTMIGVVKGGGDSRDADEVLSTLRYLNRMKKILNKSVQPNIIVRDNNFV